MPKKISSAQASYWLLLHLRGKSFRQIAKETGKDREAIAKHVRQAALISGGHEALIQELLPRLIELYKTYLAQLCRRLDQGKDVDMTNVYNIMTGLHIFETPESTPL